MALALAIAVVLVGASVALPILIRSLQFPAPGPGLPSPGGEGPLRLDYGVYVTLPQGSGLWRVSLMVPLPDFQGNHSGWQDGAVPDVSFYEVRDERGRFLAVDATYRPQQVVERDHVVVWLHTTIPRQELGRLHLFSPDGTAWVHGGDGGLSVAISAWVADRGPIGGCDRVRYMDVGRHPSPYIGPHFDIIDWANDASMSLAAGWNQVPPTFLWEGEYSACARGGSD